MNDRDKYTVQTCRITSAEQISVGATYTYRNGSAKRVKVTSHVQTDSTGRKYFRVRELDWQGYEGAGFFIYLDEVTNGEDVALTWR